MEREYIIPLRKEFSKVPRYKKSSKSIRAIKKFISKHMKTENVVIGKYLNNEIWKNGPKNPPSKVSVKAVKEEDKVKVELIGAPEEIIKEEKPKKKSIKEKLQEKADEKPAKEEPKLEKVPEAKEKPKKEIEKPVKETKVSEKKEKVPTASELAKKKEDKKEEEKVKKVPTTKELKEKK
ncbi:hypothetical protein HOC06_00040 [Candidatus Woesearchaeota archaeon]|nr:hypothetical protein [Candidatus Woesearchaeota archaeon]